MNVGGNKPTRHLRLHLLFGSLTEARRRLRSSQREREESICCLATSAKLKASNMGTKVTKHQNGSHSSGTKSMVTKFNPDNRGDEDNDVTSDRIQRPPSGMPNPLDVQPQMTFLSVPPAVYVDDDSVSTMSAETTTILTRSSRDSSSTNLTSGGDRRLSTNSWMSSSEETKKSLPNLVAISPNNSTNLFPFQIKRSISKDEKVNMTLDDIEESPTPSHGESCSPAKEPSKTLRPLIPPRIEYTPEDVDAITKVADHVENQQLQHKTPKNYFLDSLQKRRGLDVALTKGQTAAAKLLANAGPNLMRRSASNHASANGFEENFTSLENASGEFSGGAEKKEASKARMRWNPNSASLADRYKVNQPRKGMEWSYNITKQALDL